MRPLSASELLEVWERGWAQPPIQRAITLLALARPETPLESLAKLSIGQRNAGLLTLREQMFGPQLASLAKCSSCGEQLELTFAVADILRAGEPEPAERLAITHGDFEMRFRLPNSEDLAAVVYGDDSATMRQRLFERCVLAAHHNSEVIAAGQLPAEVVETAAVRMAQADPQADVRFTLSCPQCGYQMQASFDIAAFFWSEIHAWASRLLHQVHALASAYGWSEPEILAMSPWRRQLYLEMIKA
ncbi:MAG: phage baseplate protein [bacterium]